MSGGLQKPGRPATLVAKGSQAAKILVAYSSRSGTTQEVAETIGNELAKCGAAVDVADTNTINDLHPYNAVVIGSPINYDHWLPQARQFVIDNESQLKDIPVAFFFTCLVLSKSTLKSSKKAETYRIKLEQLSSLVNPVSITGFAGVLDYSNMSVSTKIVSQLIYKLLGVTEGDYRDMDAIRSWSNNIYSNLKSG